MHNTCVLSAEHIFQLYNINPPVINAQPESENSSPGQTGVKGEQGSIGAPGKVGPAGPKGYQGYKGDTGVKGDKGEKGDQDITTPEKIATLENKITSLETSLSMLKNIVLFQMAQTANGKKMYTVTWREENYAKAQAICETYGGTLPSIRNSEENSILHTVVKMVPHRKIFLGINDIKTEGTFMYQDGEVIKYKNWEPQGKEPNGGRRENCVEMRDHGKWIDISCDNINQVVCEFQFP
ncbi:mannose-binding protein isoform X2 [Bombina bombina]|uniref:mannose-binding protein isoform X2 n=1 Tax=Bombina bombina TaxID=8345 RepID=UPI00235ABD48|nr:mannose-binding protein isoform X2 [Bombina bombina]